MDFRFPLICLFALLGLSVSANDTYQIKSQKLDPIPARKEIKRANPDTVGQTSLLANDSTMRGKSLVYLENSDILMFDKERFEDVQILLGNVRFRHDDIFLYCDSAYFYEKANSLDAFSNVKIVQGDTLFVYGDVLYYDGNTKMARLRKHVRMENKNSVLTTDSLNYDRLAGVGYYFTGGKLQDELNTLVSVYGYYYPSTNVATFCKNVKLTNPNFILNSDTLGYNTKTRIADILGPTHIYYEEKTHIYSERGWYDTHNEYSMLLNNSYVEHEDTKRLFGDTIFYDKASGMAQAYKNIELADTLKKVSLLGHYGFYNEKTEQGLVVDSAMMMEYSGTDTLYLHADTLYTFADSIYKVVEAYRNVRFYRKDMQGVADSMSYMTRDSTLQMMYQPIVWSEEQQITGDTIRAYLKNGSVDKAHVIGSAFACQQKDSIYFNQLSGKEIWAFMKDSALYKVETNGNAESIFFPVDEADGDYMGMNRTESSYLNAYFKEGKINRIVLLPSPSGKLVPMDKLTKEMLYFPNYTWQVEYRPLKKEDIFLDLKRPLKKEAPQKKRRVVRNGKDSD